MNKPVRFSHHALDAMVKRGATAEEVREAISRAAWLPAKASRFECAQDFVYNSIWNGKHYKTKQVVPVFREERDAILVVTVYVFYF